MPRMLARTARSASSITLGSSITLPTRKGYAKALEAKPHTRKRPLTRVRTASQNGYAAKRVNAKCAGRVNICSRSMNDLYLLKVLLFKNICEFLQHNVDNPV